MFSTQVPVRGLHVSAPMHVTPSHANVHPLLRQTQGPTVPVAEVGAHSTVPEVLVTVCVAQVAASHVGATQLQVVP